MSYSDLISISLGSSQSGLSLNAQILDQAGLTLIGGISGTFTELGAGNYLWYYTGFPFVPSVAKIYAVPNSGVFATVVLDPPGQEILGNNIVTFDIQDQFAQVVPSAKVEILPSGSSSVVELSYVNASTGSSTFNLDSGQYEVIVSSPGYASYNNPYWFNVQGNNTYVIQGNKFTMPLMPAQNFCTLYTWLSDLGLSPIAGSTMTVRPSGAESYAYTNTLFKQPLTVTSDDTGYISINLAANVPIRCQLQDAKVDIYFMTPASGTINLASLLPL